MIRVPRRPRTAGRSPSCPKSKAPSSRSIRVTAHPRAGGRLRLQQEQVQPRHPGLAPAGLVVQAVHLLGALEKGFTPPPCINDAPLFFDAGVTGGSPGSRRTTTASSKARCGCTRRWPSRRTWCRSASCRRSARIRAGLRHALRLRCRQAPALSDDGAGRGLGDAVQMATAYAVFANGGYRIDPWLITRSRDDRGNRWSRPTGRCRQRVGARDRRAQRLHHGQHAAR